jgi:hypothetical protein
MPGIGRRARSGRRTTEPSLIPIDAALWRFSFEGTELQYVYTKAPNRGMALVTIDGMPRGTIDLYDPQIVWHVGTVFGALKAGPHQVEIQILGRHDSASSGDFVDIDALVGR